MRTAFCCCILVLSARITGAGRGGSRQIKRKISHLMVRGLSWLCTPTKRENSLFWSAPNRLIRRFLTKNRRKKTFLGPQATSSRKTSHADGCGPGGARYNFFDFFHPGDTEFSSPGFHFCCIWDSLTGFHPRKKTSASLRHKTVLPGLSRATR